MFKVLLSKKYDLVFFSPHLDDIVFSCGGLVLKSIGQKKKVLIITVFSGIGKQFTSKSGKDFIYASGYHTPSELFEQRKLEDHQASKLIGFDYLHLDYPDAIFRDTNMLFFRSLLYPHGPFTALHKKDIHTERQILLSIKEIIKSIKKESTYYYFPLGIGGHVDHILLNQISRDLQIYNKYYYEEFPYIISAYPPINQALNWERYDTTIIKLNRMEVKQKLMAMEAYTSQIKSTFGKQTNFRFFYNHRYSPNIEMYYQQKNSIGSASSERQQQ